MNLIGVRDVSFNHPKAVPYPGEYIP
jgi:hypothetical protein